MPEPLANGGAEGNDESKDALVQILPAPPAPLKDEVESVTEAEVFSGLVGQSAVDVTCAVVR